MRDFAAGAVKRLALETLGWTVLTLGVLALFLPGPGLLLTFAGLAILSTQYAWAKNLTEPVKLKALRGAAEGVETRLRVALSALVALTMSAIGVVWVLAPPAPDWWPLDERWWLFGGTPVGWTVLGSSLIAHVLLVYSVRRFHHRPAALAELGRMEAEHRRKVEARKADHHQHHRHDDHEHDHAAGDA
ncbi:PGPGW domain-containing protein [Ornithinimicrobium tianjinense]|uniref:PGPGW domain-containing protein n=1 Tax=Ornithinimicrobium tianjinense TaxID=1195761 RepID=UPI001E6423B9|nr:PGPGW domain-containing protein [Ornithinimicrobium tianjinense]